MSHLQRQRAPPVEPGAGTVTVAVAVAVTVARVKVGHAPEAEPDTEGLTGAALDAGGFAADEADGDALTTAEPDTGGLTGAGLDGAELGAAELDAAEPAELAAPELAADGLAAAELAGAECSDSAYARSHGPWASAAVAASRATVRKRMVPRSRGLDERKKRVHAARCVALYMHTAARMLMPVVPHPGPSGVRLAAAVPTRPVVSEPSAYNRGSGLTSTPIEVRKGTRVQGVGRGLHSTYVIHCKSLTSRFYRRRSLCS